MSARERLADLVLGAEFLSDRRSTYPVTCLLLLVQAASYALLRLWQEGYLPIWIDFQGLWEGSLLSLDGYRRGLWYSLMTRQLVVYDLPTLLFAWLGLWLFGSHFERRYGSLSMLVFALLSSVAAGAAFLWTSTWIEAAQSLDAGGWQLTALEWLRPEWRSYRDVWLAEPLFASFAVLALFRQPRGRSLAESLPMRALAIVLLAAGVTVLPWYLKVNVAFDSHLAAAALPLALVLLGLPWRVLSAAGDAMQRRAGRRARAAERAEQGDLDRLLAKVSSQGLDELSVVERNRLDKLSRTLRRGAS